MLACCISACVSVNRFGFALDGALCSLDRIYYDFKNGLLKKTDPRWPGFVELKKISGDLSLLEDNIGKLEFEQCYKEEEKEEKDDKGQPIVIVIEDTYCNNNELYNKKYKKLYDSLNILKDILSPSPLNKLKDYFEVYEGNFKNLETKFLKECHDYGKILFRWMKVLSMIYFCLFLITVTLAGVAMMFYACLKRQGYLITIMHVLWNVIRFFMFSFFIFGAAYGIFDLILRDSVALVKKLFSDECLGKMKDPDLVPSAFLGECLEKESNFASKIMEDNDGKLISELQNFYYTYKELKNILEEAKTKKCETNTNKETNNLNEDSVNPECGIIEGIFQNLNKLCKFSGEYDCDYLPSIAYDKDNKGGIFGSFDCGFLQNNLDMVYRALYDISKESKILSALSLTSSFFGAVAVYFYLLVLHHYNNELFFDSGKSIFRGFDGFGGGYKKKNRNQDPAYKKRKLRAEIELTSRNEEDNNYKDINKNEEDD